MVMKKFKPTSPGSRFREITVRTKLSKEKPLKALTKTLKKTGGRNNMGVITTRHIGGGHKRKYRQIDFLRTKDNVPAKVVSIAYDPNRTAHIALLQYVDGFKNYILAPTGLEIGDEIISSANEAPIRIGNCLPLRLVPVGTNIHAIELKPGKGAQLARSAGVSAQLIAKEGNYALIKLKSGESRQVLMDCRATIGEVGNSEHNLTSYGKAGAMRRLGVRPTVRGVAMNPIDHPLGGGEGKTSGGRHPVTPWGVPTKGYKTRSNKRTSRFIVRNRHAEKRGK